MPTLYHVELSAQVVLLMLTESLDDFSSHLPKRCSILLGGSLSSTPLIKCCDVVLNYLAKRDAPLRHQWSSLYESSLEDCHYRERVDFEIEIYEIQTRTRMQPAIQVQVQNFFIYRYICFFSSFALVVLHLSTLR